MEVITMEENVVQENEQKKVVAISAIWWFSSGLAAGILIGLMIARLLLDSYR